MMHNINAIDIIKKPECFSMLYCVEMSVVLQGDAENNPASKGN